MRKDRLIAGMWGTSNLRVFLIEDGALSAVREGAGASSLTQQDFERTLFELIDDWLSPDLVRGIVLAGMAGSTIGWVNTPYTECPVDAEDLALNTTHQARGRQLHIIHGLACTNIFGQPDVMRGEETELMGLLGFDMSYRIGEYLVCIPGTHAKWARLRDGHIVDFTTSIAGELFAGLHCSGVLVNPACKISNDVTTAFKAGVELAREEKTSLMHSLFSVRARQIVGVHKDSPDAAADRLAGLVIGSDVAAALSYPEYSSPTQTVMVIGNYGIAERYGAAVEICGRKAVLVSAESAAVSGFWTLSNAIEAENKTHGVNAA